MTLTVSKLKAAMGVLRANEAPPQVVKDQAEADWLTSIDPLGETWNVGDKFYLFGDPDLGRLILIDRNLRP